MELDNAFIKESCFHAAIDLDKYKVALLLGAGASKPLGIPTTEDMAKEFLETTSNNNLKTLPLADRQGLDIEEVIRVVQNIKRLVQNEGLEFIKQFDGKVMNTIIGLSTDFEVTEKELFSFIRTKCLAPDVAKAKEIYEPLLALRERATLKIFTTNYDIAIEGICRELKIEYSDGFKWSPFEDYPKFDATILEDKDIQLYKMHGSVNWWSDNSRQTIFRLSLELQGVPGVSNLMIYPAQKEDIFNYPFNIFQSVFIRTLNDVEELIAIGHKFRDINIASAVKVALERPNFRLTIISPSADAIKTDIFQNHERIESVNKKIEDCISTIVADLINKASVYNARKEEQNRQLMEKTRREIIAEHEARQGVKRIIAKTIKLSDFVTCISCKTQFEYKGPRPATLVCPNCNRLVNAN